MGSYLASPVQWHRRNHTRDEPVESCWRCARGRDVCKSKRVYGSGHEAYEAAVQIGCDSEWTIRLWGYHCRWCGLYHLAKAKSKHDARKVERVRRRIVAAAAGGPALRPVNRPVERVR